MRKQPPEDKFSLRTTWFIQYEKSGRRPADADDADGALMVQMAQMARFLSQTARRDADDAKFGPSDSARGQTA